MIYDMISYIIISYHIGPSGAVQTVSDSRRPLFLFQKYNPDEPEYNPDELAI